MKKQKHGTVNPEIASFPTGNGAPVTGAVQFFRDPLDVSEAQAYADRVWARQSVDADPHWRRGRVQEALEGQGLSMEGVVLP